MKSRAVRRRMLSQSIHASCAALDLVADNIVDGLLDVAEAYREALNSEGGGVSRGALLRELGELRDLPPARVANRIAILPMEAVRALYRQAPAGRIEFAAADSGSSPMVLPACEAVEIAALKNVLAHLAREGRPSLLEARLHVSDGPEITLANVEDARAALVRVAAEEPDEFQRHVARTVEYLLDVFQVRDQPEGRNVAAAAGLAPHPDWWLMNAILDRIWPTERGKLHSSRMKAVRRIVEKAKLSVLNDAEAKVFEMKNVVDPNWLAAILTLRHQIHSLNESLLFVDRAIFRLYEGQLPPAVRKVRSNFLYRAIYNPLRDWRRELQRRLALSDYRPWKIDIRRPTGAVLQVPAMPRLRIGTRLALRTVQLARAMRSSGPRAT